MVNYEIIEFIKKKSNFKCINKRDSRENSKMRNEEER